MPRTIAGDWGPFQDIFLADENGWIQPGCRNQLYDYTYCDPMVGIRELNAENLIFHNFIGKNPVDVSQQNQSTDVCLTENG